MLENMFVGRPPGNYDRLLDYSFAKTGNLFFAPSATFLENVEDSAPPGPFRHNRRCCATVGTDWDGSLRIGSLKGDPAS